MFGITKFKYIRNPTLKDVDIFDDLSQGWVEYDYSCESDSRLEDLLIDWLALDSMCSRLKEQEEIWRDRQPMLRNHGYMLRPRLRVGWMPSWRLAGERANPFRFEDSKALPKSHSDALFHAIDARRISDGKLVHIKRIRANSVEHKIAGMLLHEASDTLMLVIDVFLSAENPKEAYIVTPFLRPANSPAFDSVSDILNCGEQLLENLVALHSKGIAHRSIAAHDLVVDAAPLYPQGFHPIQDDCLPDGITPTRPSPRKHTPVNYYITDFRASVRFPAPYDPQRPPMLDADRGIQRVFAHGDMPPELRDAKKGVRVQYDPCMLDVWLLGKALDNIFNQTGHKLAFLRPMFDRMCHPDPGSRPTAVEALRQWREVRAERMGYRRQERNYMQWLRGGSIQARVRSKSLAMVRRLGDRDSDASSRTPSANECSVS